MSCDAASAPSIPGIFQSKTASAVRMSFARRANRLGHCLFARGHGGHLTRKRTEHVRQHRARAGVVVGDEHRQVAELRRRVGASPDAPRGMSNCAVNENVLPVPGVLSTRISPPIIVTRRREIARPRPAPPKRREFDESTCVKARRASADAPARCRCRCRAPRMRAPRRSRRTSSRGCRRRSPRRS